MGVYMYICVNVFHLLIQSVGLNEAHQSRRWFLDTAHFLLVVRFKWCRHTHLITCVWLCFFFSSFFFSSSFFKYTEGHTSKLSHITTIRVRVLSVSIICCSSEKHEQWILTPWAKQQKKVIIQNEKKNTDCIESCVTNRSRNFSETLKRIHKVYKVNFI